MRLTNLLKSGLVFVSLSFLDLALHAQFLNVDFGAGTNSPKVGFAAAGQSANDYWNFYTRDDGSGGYRTVGAVNNLKWADRTVSAVGLTVTNAAGAWQNGTADPMYNAYLYPLSGGNITATVTNLPVGSYDLYLYGHGGPGVDTANSVFQVVSGSSDYGTKATTTTSGWTSPLWQEGQQYVVFRNVEVVNAGGSVTITVFPGVYGQAYISGMQVVQKSLSSPCVSAPSGLLSWWPGEGNAADVVHGNFGTLQNGAAFATGKVGQAFTFDGVNDYVSFGNTAGNFGTNDFTIEFWIKTTSTRLESVLAKWPSCGHASFFSLRLENGKIAAEMEQDGSGSNANNHLGNKVVNDGIFHHLALVRRTTNASLYIDGVLDISNSAPGITSISNNVDLLAGSGPCVGFGGTQFFTGQLDEISVYSRALSISEIQAIYNTDRAGKCLPSCATPPTGLVSWWRGEGGAADQVGTNPGTVTGGLVFTNGIVGQAFDFNGIDSQVSFGNTVGNFDTNDFTIDFWIRTTSTRLESLIEKWPVCGASSEWYIRISGSPNASAAGLLGAEMMSDNLGNDRSTLLSQRAINDGVFHHVAFVRRGRTIAYYIDGVLDSSSDSSGGVTRINNTANLTVGKSVCVGIDGTSPFSGRMDEIDIFNRALSADEIAAIYQTGSAGKCVSTCVAAPAGLVSWWPSEGNGSDLKGGNTGNLQGNASFVPGVVGQAFEFDGTGDGVVVGNPMNLQLQNFTIETWIRRRDPLKASAVNTGAAIFDYGSGGYGFGMLDNGQLFLTKVDVSNVISDSAVTDTNWHHVSVTKSSSSVVFYIDGVAHPVPSPYDPGFVFTSSAAIGARGDNLNGSFLGDIDELAIYSLALLGAELQAIYAAGNKGKCSLAPPTTLSINPPAGFYTNALTVTLSATATNVSIRYTLDGTIPTTNSQVYVEPFALTNTATVSALAFTNGVKASEIAVSTFRFWGASSGCVSPPGAISWWTGDGDAEDELGLNRGFVLANTKFEPGLVGQAFGFGAEGDAVTVANSPSLQLQNFTIEAWVKRRSTNQATLGTAGGGVVFAYGSGGYGFSLFDDGRLTLTKVRVSYVASTTAVTDTNWHHLAVTRSGTLVSFYIDGVAGGTTNYNTTFSFTANAAIGSTGDSLAASFYGLIDELAIYGRALSTNEIRSLFDAGINGKCPAFAPIIIAAPQNRSVPVGGNTSFSVTAGGSPLLNYQWSFNGTPIPSATNALLAVANVQATNAGTYTVTVSNGFAPSATASATLAVSVPPAITQQPKSQTVLIGSTATFTVGYTGTPPLTFQWRRNGILVTGGSSPTLVINNVQSANAGTYTVRISNALNFVFSDPATLTVASGQFSTLMPTASGIQLNVQGEVGGNYIIETSSDLKQWDPLATLLNNPQNWQFTDTSTSGVSQRFYRLRKSP